MPRRLSHEEIPAAATIVLMATWQTGVPILALAVLATGMLLPVDGLLVVLFAAFLFLALVH